MEKSASLIISIVGSIICYQAIPYMENHEHHYHILKSRQPRFFFVMLLFLGGMNGLVLFNDLTFIYFFFEVTTLCSFLLIGHDLTSIATQNALRALWMNSVGGAAFIVGINAAYHETGTLELQKLLTAPGALKRAQSNLTQAQNRVDEVRQRLDAHQADAIELQVAEAEHRAARAILDAATSPPSIRILQPQKPTAPRPWTGSSWLCARAQASSRPAGSWR